MMNRVGRIRTAPRRNCRGGSQPPARYKPTITNQLGRRKYCVGRGTIQPDTQFHSMAGGYEPPLHSGRTAVGIRRGAFQFVSRCRAGLCSRPYDGTPTSSNFTHIGKLRFPRKGFFRGNRSFVGDYSSSRPSMISPEASSLASATKASILPSAMAAAMASLMPASSSAFPLETPTTLPSCS